MAWVNYMKLELISDEVFFHMLVPTVPGVVNPGVGQSTCSYGSNKQGLANHLQCAQKRDNSEKQRREI